MSERLEVTSPAADDRRHYEPPRLSPYGDLAVLTEGYGPGVEDQEQGSLLHV